MTNKPRVEAAVRLAAAHVALQNAGDLPDWRAMGHADQFEAACRDRGLDLSDLDVLIVCGALLEAIVHVNSKANIGLAVAGFTVSELIHAEVHP